MMLRKRIQRFAAAFLAALLLAASVPLAAFSADADLTTAAMRSSRRSPTRSTAATASEGKTVLLTADISLGGESSPVDADRRVGYALQGQF